MIAYLRHPAFSVPEGSPLSARVQRLMQELEQGESIIQTIDGLTEYARSVVEAYRDAYLSWHGAVFSDERFSPYRSLLNGPGWGALNALDTLPLGRAPAGSELWQRVQNQINYQCCAPGLGASLKRSPVCPACGLRLGDELVPESVDELTSELQQAIRERIALLAAESPRLRLHAERRLHASERAVAIESLCGLLESHGAIEDFDRLLTDSLTAEVRIALRTGAPRRRRLGRLRAAFGQQEWSRRDALHLVTQWLDEGESLGPHEFIILDDGE